MLVTKKEALTLWCPIAKGSHDRCISSKCAAWRWYDGQTVTTIIDLVVSRHDVLPEERRGFCGFTGRPTKE